MNDTFVIHDQEDLHFSRGGKYKTSVVTVLKGKVLNLI